MNRKRESGRTGPGGQSGFQQDQSGYRAAEPESERAAARRQLDPGRRSSLPSPPAFHFARSEPRFERWRRRSTGIMP